ncbi:MAG: MarR family winged helix-turn-helix transcriptional regulator [Beijerinckiaceae bacterium]
MSATVPDEDRNGENRTNAASLQEATSEPESDFVLHGLPGHLIRRLQQAAVSLFMQQMEAGSFELTPVQFAALTGIKTYPNLDQAALAGLIAYDRATIGGVIDRLEGKGLIRRAPSLHDRRVRQLHIEPAGEQLLREVAPVVERAQEQILEPLNQEEKLIFMLLLKKLVRSNNDRTRVPMRPITNQAPKGRDDTDGSR